MREGRGGKIDYLGKRRRWMGKGEGQNSLEMGEMFGKETWM